MSERLKSLEELGHEFERLTLREHRRRRRAWSSRAPLLAVVAAVSLSAGAFAAATGILQGEPVRNPAGTPAPRADTGMGIATPSNATLTALRVNDPDGGLPWGLRALKTTRAQGCVQVGRVLDDQLGALGQDGAFFDDGRFHRLDANLQETRNCEPLDGAGQAFIAVSFQGLPASGLGGSCLARPFPDRPGIPQRARRTPLCPKRDLRVLYYGLLGPEAESVSFTGQDGRPQIARTSGRDGAYLVVLRPSKQRPATGQFVTTNSPGSGLTAVTYRDGSTCTIRSPRSLGGAKLCPREGYVALPQQKASAAGAARELRARFLPDLVRPLVAGGTPSPAQRVLRVSFVARVPAGPRRSYLISLKADRPKECGNTYGSFTPIGRNIRAGETVTQDLYFPPDCRSGQTGAILLGPGSGPPTSTSGALAGRFHVNAP